MPATSADPHPAALTRRSARPPARDARRRLLREVTLRLIAERGIDNVNHRTVAEAADVPLGSTTYWFSSRQEMLLQALQHFAELETATLHERLEGITGKRLGPGALVDRFIEILLPQVGSERWRTIAQYALLQEAAHTPELRPACREWTRAWETALCEVFVSLEAKDPELEARMFLGMLDGLLLGQVATPDDEFVETVLRPALHAWFGRVAEGAS